jgi:glyoxylase-like metal-dependent hydrolase (beta-lactamase superfamily II)
MRIHHLNCGTHCPLGGALFDGEAAGLFARITTHVLLIETPASGLVLVDSGYGLEDVRRPHPRLPHAWRALLNVRLREEDTALRQVEALGFSAGDVRHVVLTHLDFDHTGGLSDFPAARVHVLAAEKEAALRHAGFVGHERYRLRQWTDVQDWRTYAAAGEPWLGFEAVRALDGLPPEILMIPLRGHTLGHAGVAVQAGESWLLHAGDAYLHRGQMDLARPHMPRGLAAYQHVMDSDRPARRANIERLRELKRAQGGVRVFCAHDTRELEAMRGRSLGRGE